MALDWEDRMIMAARRAMASGEHITQQSRAFWAQFDLPSLTTRGRVLREANALIEAAAQAESGQVAGTLADLLTDAGLPTTPDYGGLTGGTQGTVFATIEFTNDAGEKSYRSISIHLPFDTSLDSMWAELDDTIAEYGDFYELGEGSIVPGSLIVY